LEVQGCGTLSATSWTLAPGRQHTLRASQWEQERVNKPKDKMLVLSGCFSLI